MLVWTKGDIIDTDESVMLSSLIINVVSGILGVSTL